MPPLTTSPEPQVRSAGIREVARQSGVSIATVSRVFNDGASVQQETRQRVLDHAAALGYEPSPLGRNLVTGRSYLMGLIVPNISFPLYGAMMNGAEDYLAGRGMRVLLASSHDDLPTELGAAGHLLRYAVDAGIVINSLAGEGLPRQRQAPWVHIAPEQSGLPWRVELDNEAGGRLAAEELMRGGARYLAFVAGYGRESAERERGFAGALWGRGLRYRRVEGDYSVESGERAVHTLQGAPLDGVFAAGDLMAAGVLRSLHHTGRRVPQDVAVIGFDDTPVTALLYPPLSSVRPPAAEMGAAAAELAMNLLAGAVAEPVTVQPQLIRRDSTAPP